MTDLSTTPTTDATPAVLADFDAVPAIAAYLNLPRSGVTAVVTMLAEGNTVPFIARYRKERTGGLDEVQIRNIEEARTYLVELEDRRRTIIASIQEQGKMTPELAQRLAASETKAQLEDLYAPYRARRKTRASVARERGLEPLALRIVAQAEDGNPLAEAQAFVSAEREVATAADALAGARDIVSEMVADAAENRAYVRRVFGNEGELVAEVVAGKADEPTKFEQYYGHRESVRQIPSHRFLAIRRGEAEGVLRAHIAVDADKIVDGLTRLMKQVPASPWAQPLRDAVADAYKRLLAPSIENDVRAELKVGSDIGAADVFAQNLRNLMLSAPLGARSVMGVDPGIRTGCKCAAVDNNGKFLDTITIYISQGEAQLAKAKDDLTAFLRKHGPLAIAVGNGTGGREAEAFVRRVVADAALPEAVAVVSVNEAGASVYSASDLAREEFPELDLTIRGAISIARRLQDPLAELVKIEPKAIGVGQYQHDVHQPMLSKKLNDVVESCVNHVGVEINTASAQLLQYVAGIGKALAKKIVAHRDSHGSFTTRGQLLTVAGLGPKAFEQAAGFLRIRGGGNPLDASAVHPERYPIVEKMASTLGVAVADLVGNQELVDKIDLASYVDANGEVGEATLRDIAAELTKPGRDPRATFDPPRFREDVTTIDDLKPGMVLEGLVSNVTAFGAFVDIGVHNDGLVHVSQLGGKFIKDPSELVKVGQKVTVKVLEVDLPRRRIALTLRVGGGEHRNDGGQRSDAGDNRSDNRGPRRDRGPRPDNRGPRPDNRGPRPAGDGAGHAAAAPQGDIAVRTENSPRPNNRGPRPDNRGPRPDNRGPRPDNRGPRPDNRGPRTDGNAPHVGSASATEGQGTQAAPRPANRGPRPDNRGPRTDVAARPDNRGPRPDGAPRGDNRGGPRFDGPRGDNRGGPRFDGPRGDNRGPRNDGPRRDDRGPRTDAPRRDEPAGFGIAGFVNNPFAALVKGDKQK
ncbi:MAG: helix-hairpin-helix domain-containing protein [Kofleriaceae bacterium]|nr:helix-hairpin-helix domain-containing protein [Kofleriaceae bacterium]